MKQLIIRKATLNDLATLLKFEQGVIEAERPFDSTLKRIPTTYYDLNEMINANHINLLVAELKGELVSCGYARIESAKEYLQHTHFGYLGFMFTIPKYRGKGINKSIIDELVSWCATQNIYEIRLEVYNENEAAIKAYEKAGFIKHMITMRIKEPQKQE